MLNKLLGGHYRVIKKLGRGGLAQTYIVEDQHRPGYPKCVAKFLKPADNDPDFLPTARRLFLQEAEILEKLGQHEQIPRLLAYFEQNEQFFLVQEFIEGNTLSKELKIGSRWSEIQVIQMLKDVLPILEFVHSHGVIHRDIKPNNFIRRQKDGRLVLIDFGIVKQIPVPKILTQEPLSQKTISIGTQGYMPSEQLRGKPRLNSDIYALGIICVQALTGVIPLDFREDKNGEIIWQHLVEVSDELAVVLNKMIRYHFLDRYQSATEVLQALKSLTNHDRVLPANLIATKTNLKIFSEQKEKNSSNTPANSDFSLPTKVTEKLQPTLNHELIFASRFVNRVASPKVSLEKIEKDNFIFPPNLDFIRPTKVTERLQPTLNHEKIFFSRFVKRVASLKVSLEKTEKDNFIFPPHLKFIRPIKVIDKVKSILNHEPIFSSTLVKKLLSPILAVNREEKNSLMIPGNSLILSDDLKPINSPIFVPLDKSLFLVGAGIVSTFITLFIGYTYINQKLNYLQAEKTLGEIEVLKTAQKYQECLQQTQEFPPKYPLLHIKAQNLWHDCQNGQAGVQLNKARELAKNSRFKDAIVLANQISANTDFYLQAQQLIPSWSEKIFQIASNKYQQGNLKEAITIASAIPINNSWAEKAKQSIQQWNQEWTQNQSKLQVAQKAIEEKRWQDAINTAEKINNNAYWQKQSELIIQKAKAEIVKLQKATASKRTYKRRSISSVTRSRSSSSSSRSKPVRRYRRKNSSRSKSVRSYRRSSSYPKPIRRYRRKNSSRSKSVRRIRSDSSYSRSTRIKSRPNSVNRRSNNWICLNNPNPKCRK